MRFYTESGREPVVFDRTRDPGTGAVPFNRRIPFQQGEDTTGQFIDLQRYTGDAMFGW